jgi:hypothetical protein
MWGCGFPLEADVRISEFPDFLISGKFDENS